MPADVGDFQYAIHGGKITTIPFPLSSDTTGDNGTATASHPNTVKTPSPYHHITGMVRAKTYFVATFRSAHAGEIAKKTLPPANPNTVWPPCGFLKKPLFLTTEKSYKLNTAKHRQPETYQNITKSAKIPPLNKTTQQRKIKWQNPLSGNKNG